MAFIPQTITPEFSLLKDHADFSRFKSLKFPRDAFLICWMTLEQKQVWYASCDPQELISLAQNKQFLTFWRRFYTRPLKIKRALYKLKFW